MPDIYQRHADGVRAVQDYIGPACPVFTWAGKDYKLFPSSAKRKKDMGLGGFAMQADFQFLCLANQFGDSLPDQKQTITYRGNSYRIQDIDILPGGELMRFHCNDANQGL